MYLRKFFLKPNDLYDLLIAFYDFFPQFIEIFRDLIDAFYESSSTATTAATRAGEDDIFETYHPLCQLGQFIA